MIPTKLNDEGLTVFRLFQQELARIEGQRNLALGKIIGFGNDVEHLVIAGTEGGLVLIAFDARTHQLENGQVVPIPPLEDV